MSEFCKPKVIVVDDEHLIADTLTTILSRAGYDRGGRTAATRQSRWH